MLQFILISNLKSFEDVNVPLGPITLIYGPNSGGKSTIIQALLLLKQTVAAGKLHLVPQGDYIDLGGFASLIHNHDVSKHLVIGVMENSSPAQPYLSESGVNLGTYQVSCMGFGVDPETDRDGVQGALRMLTYSVSPPDLTGKWCRLNLRRSTYDEECSLPGNNPEFIDVDHEPRFDSAMEASDHVSFLSWFCEQLQRKLLGLSGQQMESLSPEQVNAVEKFSRLAVHHCHFLTSEGALPGPLERTNKATQTWDFEESIVNWWQELIKQFPALENRYSDAEDPGTLLDWELRPVAALSDRFRSLLGRIDYIGPLREFPERQYQQRDLGVRVGAAGVQEAVRLLSEQPRLVVRLNGWLAYLKVPYEVVVGSKHDQIGGLAVQLSLRDRRNKATVALRDVGFGISQMLPILVKGMTSADKTLCCEQPELHLHPRLQAQLADFIIETANVAVPDNERPAFSDFPRSDSLRSIFDRGADAKRVQWIIETHSELLILRIQRRIREGILKADDVCVLYVDSDNDGARVNQLRLDEKGEFIDEWPDGFFDDGYLEVYPPRRS